MAVTYVRNEQTGEFEKVGPGGATTDTTLSQAGKPADAAAVGNAIVTKIAAATALVDNSKKLGGKDAVYYIQPRNYLDNSNFANPVNQRGTTTISSRGYGIDRWMFTTNGTANMNTNNGAVNINVASGSYGDISQAPGEHAYLAGKIVTFAADIVGYGIMTLNFTFNAGASISSSDGKVSLMHAGSSRVYIRVNGANISIKWAALYEGTYTADNLPSYVSKSYSAELMECQRYFINNVGQRTLGAFQGADKIFLALVPTPVVMYTTPSVTLNTADNIVCNVGGKSSVIGVSGVSVASVCNNGVMVSLTTASNPGNYATGMLYSTSMTFSAEI